MIGCFIGTIIVSLWLMLNKNFCSGDRMADSTSKGAQ